MILFSLALIVSPLASLPVRAAPAASFTVNHANDVPDLNPGDGHCDGQPSGGDQCSLRAAVGESNALACNNTIILPAGEFKITPPKNIYGAE